MNRMNKVNSSNSDELKPIEDVYCSSKELEKAFQCYKDKDFGQATTYCKMLTDSRKDIKQDQLYVLAEFFRLHYHAYDVWDGTYDYTKIKKTLAKSISLLENNKSLFRKNDWNYLTALKKMSELVILGTEYENSMITSDARMMMLVAEKMVSEASEGVTAIKVFPSYGNGEFARLIDHQLYIKLKSQEAIGKFAYLMHLKEDKPLRFLEEYSYVKEHIKDRLDYLTSIKDFELASELRAHYFFLEKSYELVSDCVRNGFVKLRDGEIHYFVGILVDEKYAGIIYDKLSEKIKDNACEITNGGNKCEITTIFGIQNIQVSCDVVEEDPSDLMAESYKIEGDKSMSWLTLRLENVEITLHNKMYEAEFELHYYKYGVCNLCLNLVLPDNEDYSPSKLMLLRSLIGPHMGQTKIKWQDNEYLYIAKEDGGDGKEDNEPSVTLFRDISNRLKIIFESLANKIKELDEKQQCTVKENSFGILDKIKKWELSAANIESDKKEETFLWEYNPEMNWFSYIYIRSAVLKNAYGEEKTVMDSIILQKAPEFKALLLDSREARATIDDWIGSEEPTIKNLALIRSHKNDLLVVGENHATVYFPEDPEFVIFQYNESLEMLSNLRTITNTYNFIMNKMLRESKEVTTNIIKMLKLDDKAGRKEVLTMIRKHMLETTCLKIQTEYMCNQIMTSTISQYRDHARLMSEMIDNTTIPQTLDSIRTKIGMISETEESLDNIVSSIRSIEDARFNNYIEIVGTLIAILALIVGIIQVHTYFGF